MPADLLQTPLMTAQLRTPAILFSPSGNDHTSQHDSSHHQYNNLTPYPGQRYPALI